MKELIFISLSFLLGLLCITYVRSFDKHEKEPFFTMFAATCWGGVWSIIVASLLYEAVHLLGIGDLRNTFGALFVVGPVEEFAKLLALISASFIVRKEMNEPVDGMIYMSCVALGFSLIENYFYAVRPNEGHLLIARLFICTPMHICFSAFMGLSFYIWFKNRKAVGLLLLSFVLASISHGIYDLVIFNGLALLVLFLVVRVIFTWTMDLLSYATAQSPHRISLKAFIDAFPGPPEEKGMECPNCGSTHPKSTFSMGKILIQKCDGCEYYITTRKSLFHIFHHFAATFKNISKHQVVNNVRQNKFSTLYKSNYIADKKNIAFFKLNELNDTLEALNRSIIEKMEKKWWFPDNLLDLEKEDETVDFGKIALEGGGAFWKWLIHPFSSDKRKKLHAYPDKGPLWNWGAFAIPELWFLYHEIWGVFFLISGFYMTLVFAGIYGYFNIFGTGMLIILLLVRLISGRMGNHIYYVMHGKWPIASWN